MFEPHSDVIFFIMYYFLYSLLRSWFVTDMGGGGGEGRGGGSRPQHVCHMVDVAYRTFYFLCTDTFSVSDSPQPLIMPYIDVACLTLHALCTNACRVSVVSGLILHAFVLCFKTVVALFCLPFLACVLDSATPPLSLCLADR